MSESDEAASIRRCQDGDKEAFRTLVEKHKRILFGTAYLMVRDRGLAEDAIQEALVKVWKHLPSLHSHGSLKAWLHKTLWRAVVPIMMVVMVFGALWGTGIRRIQIWLRLNSGFMLRLSTALTGLL